MGFFSRFAGFVAPSVFQAGLSFVTLPLTTLILGPAEYGTFAVFAAVTSLGVSIATAASGMLLPAQFARLEQPGRAGLICALLACSTIILLLYIGGALAVWAWGAGPQGWNALVPTPVAASALVAMALSMPWSIAYLVVILEGAAATFARVTIAAAVVSAATTLLCLFWFGLRIEALFASYLATAAVQCAGAALVLRPYLHPAGMLSWCPRLARLTAISGLPNSLEVAQSVLERSILAGHAGPAGVGLYFHAQLYRNMLFMPLKAVSNSVWPQSLQEARDADGRFGLTGLVWAPVFLALGCVGIIAAFLADDVIGLLTHGKFSAAGPLAAAFIVLLGVQFSGKPQSATLYAHDRGEFLGKVQGLGSLAAVLALIALVPWLGVWGAACAFAVQQVAFRIGLWLGARSVRKTPFQDGIVLESAVLTGAALLLEAWLAPGLLASVLCALALCAALLARRVETARMLLAKSRPHLERLMR